MKKFFKALGDVIYKVSLVILYFLGALGMVAMSSWFAEMIFPKLAWGWHVLIGLGLWAVLFGIIKILAIAVEKASEG